MSDSTLTPWTLLIGIVLPLALLLSNLALNYAGILLTIVLLVWIGLALALMSSPSD